MNVTVLRRLIAANARLLVLLTVTGALAVLNYHGNQSNAAYVPFPSGNQAASGIPGCPLEPQAWSSKEMDRRATPTPDPIAVSSREAHCEGQVEYGEEPANVQAVMQHMYIADSSYRSLTALFVDRTPGDQPTSIRIHVRQPDLLRAGLYSNATGSGRPLEILTDVGEQQESYLPAANVYIRSNSGRSVTRCAQPPLQSIPLAETFGGCSPAIIQSTISASASVANLFVHPAELLTSPFFRNKQVTDVGESLSFGRSAVELQGVQTPLSPPLGALGDRWRLWVDARTGIVLRLEYYSGATLIGWGELADVSVDVGGPQIRPQDRMLTHWTLPANAHRVDQQEYLAAYRASLR